MESLFICLSIDALFDSFDWFLIPKTARPLGRGQDAESNFVNPHSFRNLSAYSWKIPLTVFIPFRIDS